jgi:hypothetical protein
MALILQSIIYLKYTIYFLNEFIVLLICFSYLVFSLKFNETCHFLIFRLNVFNYLFIIINFIKQIIKIFQIKLILNYLFY